MNRNFKQILLFAGKTRVLWTDLVLTMILIGGLLTIFVMGTVDSGGMSAVVHKAKIQDHFQRDSFSFRPTHQVRELSNCLEAKSTSEIPSKLMKCIFRTPTYLLSLDTISSGLLSLPVFTHLVARPKCPIAFVWLSFILRSFYCFCQPFS